jgi:hypothetical protein
MFSHGMKKLMNDPSEGTVNLARQLQPTVRCQELGDSEGDLVIGIGSQPALGAWLTAIPGFVKPEVRQVVLSCMMGIEINLRVKFHRNYA